MYGSTLTMSGSIETVVTLNGSNSYTGATTINGGTLKIGANHVMPNTSVVVMANTAGAILDVNGKTDTIGSLSGGGASGGYITLESGSGTGALTVNQFTYGNYAGVISGAGSFTKSSYGPLRLNGANTYSGGTTITEGEIIVGVTNALPNATALTFTGTSKLLLLSDGVTQSIGSLSADGVTGAEINLLNNSNVLTVTQSVPEIYSGTIIGAGALTKAGSSTLTLSGANTYRGRTTINAGIIELGGANVMPDTSEVFIAAGATLDVNDKIDTIGSLSGAGNITLGASSAVLEVNQFTYGHYSGVISGDGSFIKSSYGVLKLTSANTYTGTTSVTGGDLIIMINGGIPNTALSLTGTSRLLLLKDGLSLNVGTLSGDAGALAWLYPNSTLTIDQASGTNTTFAGTIKDNTSGSVVKTGSGTLNLTGSNTYQGSTTVSAGTLNLSATNAIASSIAMNVASGAILNINGTQTIGALSGSGNINLSSAVLTIEQRTFSEYLGVISGTASTITKEGAGVLKLKAANTYSGNTILAAGEIIVGVSNALPTASAVSFTGASRLLMLEEGISQGFSSLTSSVPSSSIFGYKKNTFNLNQSGASTFAGGLFGGFSFVKSGDGTLTLTSGAQGSVLTTTRGTVN
jgi:autotransporter-associated beta strand protein